MNINFESGSPDAQFVSIVAQIVLDKETFNKRLAQSFVITQGPTISVPVGYPPGFWPPTIPVAESSEEE